MKEKKLSALGVSPAARSRALPEVPTIAEAGVAGFEFDTWYGIFAAAAVPKPLIAKISQDIAKALALPDVQERFARRGVVPKPSTPEVFDNFVRTETAKLGKIIKAAGIRLGALEQDLDFAHEACAIRFGEEAGCEAVHR